MKAIILCAGYATRLHPLTLEIPKALLLINQKPLIEYIIEKVNMIKVIDEIIIVTNNKFYQKFIDWNQKFNSVKSISIINDNTNSDKERLGGIGDLNFVIKNLKIFDDLLVILGDNYFDFDLNELIDIFNKNNSITIGLKRLKNDSEQNFGIVKIANDIVISFDDYKGKKDDLISIGIYIFTFNDIKKIFDYMDTDLSKEGPGFLIKDWIKIYEIYAYEFKGEWYDIGSIKVYNQISKLK